MLVHQLPDNGGLEVTAINFGAQTVDESIVIHGAAPHARATDVLNPGAPALELATDGGLHLHLDGFEAKALHITG